MWGRTHLTQTRVRCIRPPDPDGSGFLSVKLCSGDGSRPLRVQAPGVPGDGYAGTGENRSSRAPTGPRNRLPGSRRSGGLDRLIHSLVPQKVNLRFEAAVLSGDGSKPAPRGTGFACFRCGAGASPLRGPSPGVIVKQRIHRKFRKENRQYWRLTNVRFCGNGVYTGAPGIWTKPIRNVEFGIVHPSSDPRGSAGRMQAVPAGTVVYVPAIRTLCQANAEYGMWNSILSPGIDPATGNRELATDNRELFTLDWVMVFGERTHLTRIPGSDRIRPPDPDGSGFLSVKLSSGDGSRPLRV